MDRSDYRHWAHRAADWSADYLETLRERPVRPRVGLGETAAKLAASPPESPEPMEAVFADFERIVPDAMTHWQHPRFLAYFPANAAPASMIADQLATAMAAQCMLWQTSPAATEMEGRMIDWLRQAVGLPEGFSGTLQDSATTATLCAILTMRERATGWQAAEDGLAGGKRLRIYASAQNHSSIDKAVRLAGIGEANLVKVPTCSDHGMDPDALAAAIRADREAGHVPAGVVACAGGTSIGAFDPVADVVAVAREAGLFVHVDAAWAGSAMICPEFRQLWQGAGEADSLVFNPHKWLGAQFECSAHLVRDPAALVRTVGFRPTYLETLGQDGVVNYNEWSVPLGRRFRALKVWFLLRAYGLEGLRARIRNHVDWARMAAARVAAMPQLELVTGPVLSLFTFAHRDGDAATRALLERLNDDGRVYLTQTVHEGRFLIRFVTGQFDQTREDVDAACAAIEEMARLRA
ncbi:MAG TPA: pyridoxal-dependent decarboxylase [Paracoccaceae bacterium]|nr:pyridoxal-dependent decarboxylase [Paracoccaceae bacterium]